MTITQRILISLIVVVGVGGVIYIGRPREVITLPRASVVSSVPSPSPQVQGAQGGALSFLGTPPPEFAGYGQAVPSVPSLPQRPQAQIPRPRTDQIPIQPLLETVRVTIHTVMGDIEVELYGEDAPLTVGNFVTLARQNYYDGTTFHRVVEDFMIQGGDSLSKDQAKRGLHGTGQLPYDIPDEINDRKLVRGSIAMANRGPNTNGSQFFIVTRDALPNLDGRHTNFGQVLSGMDVVDAIARVEKDKLDNPIEPVTVEDIVVKE